MFAKSENGVFIYAESLGIQDVTVKQLLWQKRGLRYTASGYGRKIPTSFQIKIENRWHRVYCAIFSNNGTCYIVKNKQNYILQDSDILK
jgi:hypothetical protein